MNSSKLTPTQRQIPGTVANLVRVLAASACAGGAIDLARAIVEEVQQACAEANLVINESKNASARGTDGFGSSGR